MSFSSDYVNNATQTLLELGRAQAQAAANKGQIYSQAINQIGQSLGNYKDVQQARALKSIQIQKGQNELKDQAAWDAALPPGNPRPTKTVDGRDVIWLDPYTPVAKIAGGGMPPAPQPQPMPQQPQGQTDGMSPYQGGPPSVPLSGGG